MPGEGQLDGPFCLISQQRCKYLTQQLFQPGFLLAGPPGGWRHSPKADGAGVAERFRDGLQYHSEKVGLPPARAGLLHGHQHRSVPDKNRDPQNANPGLPGLFQCSMQSQRDSGNGERCGMGRDYLWHRGGGILQVTQKDGNLPELLLL